ncbi:MAG: hypothetical protein ABIE22_04525 [archaeon]
MLRKRGMSELLERILFIVLNIIFFSIVLLFVSGAFSGALLLEKSYAKQFALTIDSASEGSEFIIDFSEGLEMAKSRGVNPEVSVDNKRNVVKVKLDNGKGYEYDFFNDVEVELGFQDMSMDKIKIVIK